MVLVLRFTVLQRHHLFIISRLIGCDLLLFANVGADCRIGSTFESKPLAIVYVVMGNYNIVLERIFANKNKHFFKDGIIRDEIVFDREAHLRDMGNNGS